MNDKPQTTEYTPHPLPPSTRLYIILETAAGALALLLTIGSLVVFKIDAGWGAKLFGWFFYPSVLCIATTLFLGITQLCRGFELMIFLPMIPAIIATVCIILMTIYQVGLWGIVYIPPFTIYKKYCIIGIVRASECGEICAVATLFL
jgi:hypothetical protein